MKLVHHTIVWGESYVQDFLRICLPTLLSPGNLPGLRKHVGSRLVLWTRAVDAEAVREAQAWRDLEQVIDCEIVPIDSLLAGKSPSKYSLLGRIQTHAIKHFLDYDAFVFIYPDSFWADGSLVNAVERLEQGYDAVLTYTPKVAREPFLAALKAANTRSNVRTIPSRTLTRLSVENLHSVYNNCFWNRPSNGEFAGIAFWDVPGQGLALRCFHMTALYIRILHGVPAVFASFSGSFDEDYTNRLAPYLNSYIVPSSDEVSGCTLEIDEGQANEIVHANASVQQLWIWAERRAGTGHRHFATFPIRWITTEGTPDEAVWSAAEERIQSSMRALDRWLSLPDEQLRIENIEAYWARQDRRTRSSTLAYDERRGLYFNLVNAKGANDPYYFDRKEYVRFGLQKIVGMQWALRLHGWIAQHRSPHNILWLFTKNKLSQKAREFVVVDERKMYALRRQCILYLSFWDLTKLYLRRLIKDTMLRPLKLR